MRSLARALTAVTHLLGVAAFVYPFFLGAAPTGEHVAHAGVAPVMFSALAVLLIAVAVAEARGADAKRLALLGVLAGVNAMLRLPGSFGGASLMFVLPVLSGAVFGARFGFLLGATSMAASAVITGGLGPWVPFQMWALGWVGAGAGLLRGACARLRPRACAGLLAIYGWGAGIAFGMLMNLWFWPFVGGDTPLSWVPGVGVAETAVRYVRFYGLTSFAWDAGRALANAVLLVTLGAPLLRVLRRARARIEVRWAPAGAVEWPHERRDDPAAGAGARRGAGERQPLAGAGR